MSTTPATTTLTGSGSRSTTRRSGRGPPDSPAWKVAKSKPVGVIESGVGVQGQSPEVLGLLLGGCYAPLFKTVEQLDIKLLCHNNFGDDFNKFSEQGNPFRNTQMDRMPKEVRGRLGQGACGSRGSGGCDGHRQRGQPKERRSPGRRDRGPGGPKTCSSGSTPAAIDRRGWTWPEVGSPSPATWNGRG